MSTRWIKLVHVLLPGDSGRFSSLCSKAEAHRDHRNSS
jgi:hypothetical protein